MSVPTTPLGSTPPKKFTPSPWSGSISIHGRAILQRRRSFVDAKGVASSVLLFDASVYLHNADRTTRDPITGVLTYFPTHSDADMFSEDDEPEIFDISASVVLNMATTLSDEIAAVLIPEGLLKTDYAFLGDIYRLDYIGSPADGHDLTRRPVFSVAGMLNAVNTEERFCQLAPSPYSRIAKEYSLKTSSPFKVIVPKSPRWLHFPTMVTGGQVSVDGFGMSVSRDDKGYVKEVILEMEKVTLLGKPAKPVIKNPVVTPSPAGSDGKRLGAGFNYADSPAPAKRRRTAKP